MIISRHTDGLSKEIFTGSRLFRLEIMTVVGLVSTFRSVSMEGAKVLSTTALGSAAMVSYALTCLNQTVLALAVFLLRYCQMLLSRLSGQIWSWTAKPRSTPGITLGDYILCVSLLHGIMFATSILIRGTRFRFSFILRHLGTSSIVKVTYGLVTKLWVTMCLISEGSKIMRG